MFAGKVECLGHRGALGWQRTKWNITQGMLRMSFWTVILAVHWHSCCMGRLSGATVPMSGEVGAMGVGGWHWSQSPVLGLLHPGLSPLVLALSYTTL